MVRVAFAAAAQQGLRALKESHDNKVPGKKPGFLKKPGFWGLETCGPLTLFAAKRSTQAATENLPSRTRQRPERFYTFSKSDIVSR